MTIALLSTYSAIAPGNQASFQAYNGTKPYTYSVAPGGAGGTINARTGIYVAPRVATASSDTISVVDSASNTATANITIGNALILVCDIVQKYMNLPNGYVYLWDQKWFEPKDARPWIVVSETSCKPIGNMRNYTSGDGLVQLQSVSMRSVLDINIYSRSAQARDRKEEVLLALNGNYSLQQQEANAFKLGKISASFNNISGIDGAAIPYRYAISCYLFYGVVRVSGVDYFDQIPTPQLYTND